MLAVAGISSSLLTTPAFAGTPSKKLHMAGRVVSTSVNTIRSGKGAPSTEIGLDGDFYIDTLKFNFYGPKINGHWPAPEALRGPAGLNGTDGKVGSSGTDGKNGVSGEKGSSSLSSGAHGSQGLQGAQGVAGSQGSQGLPGLPGLPGSQGIAGITGPIGLTGATGAVGASGPTGFTGPGGAPGSPGSPGASGATGPTGNTGTTGQTGSIGSTGATGSIGNTGATGLTGSQGIQGAVGATGSSVPSQVSVGIISFAQQLRGSSGTSVTSNPFGSFAAGKDYFVHIMIYGVRQTTSFASLRILIYPVGGSPIVQTNYLISDGFSYRTATGENETNLDVLVTVDGSAVLNPYQLSATISALEVTSTDAVTFAGTYLNELVGSIS